jgi:hypothetical protein
MQDFSLQALPPLSAVLPICVLKYSQILGGMIR